QPLPSEDSPPEYPGQHTRRGQRDRQTGNQPVIRPDKYGDPTMPPPTPVALARLFVTLLAAGLTGGIIVAAFLQSWAIISAIFGLQVLTVAAFVWLRRPSGAVITILTGVVVAAVADLIAIYT